jgi:hypothetical protein
VSRAIFFAVMVAVLPPACAKLLNKDAPPPADPLIPTAPSVPITSATTPPVWRPPDTATAPTTSGSGLPPPSDAAKARAAADAKDWKKVKQLLEKKMKSGKATSEEIGILSEACAATKDKACLADIKKSGGGGGGGDAP